LNYFPFLKVPVSLEESLQATIPLELVSGKVHNSRLLPSDVRPRSVPHLLHVSVRLTDSHCSARNPAPLVPFCLSFSAVVASAAPHCCLGGRTTLDAIIPHYSRLRKAVRLSKWRRLQRSTRIRYQYPRPNAEAAEWQKTLQAPCGCMASST
jgi:hypothetical protein